MRPTCQLFWEDNWGVYDKLGLDRSVLSRSLEEGATLTVTLIPWTTGGAFMATTLGVSALDYAPMALLNWLNPLVGIGFAFIGFGLKSAEPERVGERELSAQAAAS
ncbi:Na+/H+ antiporter NhaC family protein [Endozoicomonas sp. SCSIO W0465]|uniref:Na+/H+ antiporter NhaC family protein n=1 Tax=Endozoicomonas sp. SCSIO W0465 TaxID=2918516 RepID=UPI0020758AE6|nr:Na+/H+ antiporter NhaC family protein [Endozoicomonas sp. SCSIO W0465]